MSIPNNGGPAYSTRNTEVKAYVTFFGQETAVNVTARVFLDPSDDGNGQPQYAVGPYVEDQVVTSPTEEGEIPFNDLLVADQLTLNTLLMDTWEQEQWNKTR